MIGGQNTHIFRCGMNVLVFIPELILAIATFFKRGLPKSSVIICAKALYLLYNNIALLCGKDVTRSKGQFGKDVKNIAKAFLFFYPELLKLFTALTLWSMTRGTGY